MKVIVRNELKKQLFIVKCGVCDSVTIFDRDELRSVESDMKEHYEFAHVDCPVCDHCDVAYPIESTYGQHTLDRANLTLESALQLYAE
jgi:ribosomal protein S27E